MGKKISEKFQKNNTGKKLNVNATCKASSTLQFYTPIFCS